MGARVALVVTITANSGGGEFETLWGKLLTNLPPSARMLIFAGSLCSSLCHPRENEVEIGGGANKLRSVRVGPDMSLHFST